MPWTVATPQDRWEERELFRFFREIYNRNFFNTFTWDPPSVGAGATVDTTLTSATVPELTGLRAGMPISITPPSTVDSSIMGWAWVAADDSITIRLRNFSGSPVNMSSGTWAFMGILP